MTLVVIYLLLLSGWKAYRYLEEKREAYQVAKLEAEETKLRVYRQEVKARRFRHLKKSWNLNFDKLKPETLVGEAREAILKAAQVAKVHIGSSRESHRASSARELATIQLAGEGSTMSVVNFLQSLRGLGYPIVLDHLQINIIDQKPGHVTLTLNILVMNFNAWKMEEEGDV